MDIWQVLILAVVEGVTEFLPISSTGHLILTSKLLGVVQTDFVKSFEIAIQLGAIMAVVVLTGKRLIVDRKSAVRVGMAFIPTAIIGFAGYRLVKNYLLGNVWVTIAALAIGGIALIVIEKKFKVQSSKSDRKIALREQINSKLQISNLSYKRAVVIGLVQAMSIIPGVSRAAATILGGMAMGLGRREAVEMSFLLAIPTMLAATGYDLLKSGGSFSGSEWLSLAVGFGVAFVTAIVAVKWLISYVQRHTMVGFGMYRLMAAGLFWVLMY